MTVERLSIAVYSEMGHRLGFASSPHMDVAPEIVQQYFGCQSYLPDRDIQALPLPVDVGDEYQCVGVLYLERQEESMREADRPLFQLISRYVGIVIFNAVVELATKYRDVEAAHEETRRASWEDNMLHV